jgi:putative transposase
MIRITGRILGFRSFVLATFVKSNPSPTQLELSQAAQTKFVICEHTIDITYVPMPQGFMYLTAVIDWYSRYVLAWQLSNTLDGHFCLVALEQALTLGKPEIFNTDQGVQFTAQAFTERVERAGVQVSMDGRGRALDNIFIERLWRTLKYEHIYLFNYESVPALLSDLRDYFFFYNNQRFHQSLDYLTPSQVHFDPVWSV